MCGAVAEVRPHKDNLAGAMDERTVKFEDEEGVLREPAPGALQAGDREAGGGN